MKLQIWVRYSVDREEQKIKFPLDEDEINKIVEKVKENDQSVKILDVETDYKILTDYILNQDSFIFSQSELESLNELFDMNETDVLEVMQILQQSKEGEIDDDYWKSSISMQIDQVKSGYNFVFHPDITDESDLKNIIEDFVYEQYQSEIKKDNFLEFILYYVDWDWLTKDLIQNGDFNFQVTDYGTLEINE